MCSKPKSRNACEALGGRLRGRVPALEMRFAGVIVTARPGLRSWTDWEMKLFEQTSF